MQKHLGIHLANGVINNDFGKEDFANSALWQLVFVYIINSFINSFCLNISEIFRNSYDCGIACAQCHRCDCLAAVVGGASTLKLRLNIQFNIAK